MVWKPGFNLRSNHTKDSKNGRRLFLVFKYFSTVTIIAYMAMWATSQWYLSKWLLKFKKKDVQIFKSDIHLKKDGELTRWNAVIKNNKGKNISLNYISYMGISLPLKNSIRSWNILSEISEKNPWNFALK